MRGWQVGVDVGRRIAIEVMVIAALGLGLAALGPFGSYGVPFASRSLLWIGFILGGYVILRPLMTVAHWLANAARIDLFPAQLIAVTLGSLPLSLLIGSCLNRLAPGVADAPVERYVQVWGIGVAVTLFMNRFVPHRLAETGSADRQPTAVASPPADRAPFFERIPASRAEDLLCLSMEDHYVRAHFHKSSTLILMRMRDAVRELDGVPGLHVHRSWWVAKTAVERVERAGDGVRLRLANDLLVPVARSYSGAVRAQGWPLTERFVEGYTNGRHD